MRIAGDGSLEATARGKRAVHAAVDAGFTVFDHADIYAGGACEKLFGDCLRESPGLRDRLLIMSKCGIRPGGKPQKDSPKRYDFSRAHLERSVEGSLRRLGVERLDLLLLHRPDYLMDAAEVAEVFTALEAAGKVAHFGVSNFSAAGLELLQSACARPLLVNQVEINLHAIDALLDGTLDQCQRLGITPQAWCPLGGVAYPAWGNSLSPEAARRLREEIDRQAGEYGTDAASIALAWLLLHPAKICPLVGSATPERIAVAPRALDLDYQREDWYRLLEARNGHPVP
jgi:predicted oxidoreductase